MPLNHGKLYSNQERIAKMKCMSPNRQTLPTVNENRRGINAECKVPEGSVLTEHMSFLTFVTLYGSASFFEFHLFCLNHVEPKHYTIKDEVR